MDLESARRQIHSTLERVRVAYLRPLFDEWAILALSPKGGAVLAYQGPRPDQFRRNVPQDAEPLRAHASGKSLTEGDLEFVSDATGTQYDAFMKTGASSYLILNHTGKTLADLRADSKWLAAQALLFDLSEKFRADPLVVE